MIRHVLNPPNWFTAASIFCSVYALTLVVGVAPTPAILEKACLLIVFGAIFDLLDGRVARMTNRFTEFGVQLDSIADMVSFGAAPALLAYAWKLNELGITGVFVSFIYVVSVAFRLARFNVDSAHQDWHLDGHSQGLTSTMAGGMLVTLIWVSNGYLEGRVLLPAWALALIVCFVSLLMLSSMPFRTFRDMRKNKRARALFAVAAASSLFGALSWHPSMWFGVGAGLYLTVGLVDSVVVWAHFRSKGQPMSTEEEDLQHVAHTP